MRYIAIVVVLLSEISIGMGADPHHAKVRLPSMQGLGYWMPARELTAASALLSADGLAINVSSTTLQSADERVFNLEIAGAHNYYVGAPTGGPAVLVHNACVTPGNQAWRRLANTAKAQAKRLNAGELGKRFHRIKEKAGLRPADHILKVDDETGDVLAHFADSDIPEYIGNIFDNF